MMRHGGGGGRRGGGRVGRGRRGRARGGGRGAGGHAADDIPPMPHLRRLFAPCQRHQNDMPVIEFEVCDGDDEYSTFMDAIKRRQRDIAAETIGPCHVPITPISNPSIGSSSHYIIRLKNRNEPGWVVDLLICDVNQYFVAFRRQLIVMEGEEKVYTPGIWYCFSDQKLPECIEGEVVTMTIGSSHRGDKTTPGGENVLSDIFFILGKHEDVEREYPGAKKDNEALKKSLQRVIVIFCEATRIRTLYNEIKRRIGGNEDGSELTDPQWKLIHSWDVISYKVITLRLNGQFENMGTQLPEEFTLYGFDREGTMADLIGSEGELMLVLFIPLLLVSDSTLRQREEEAVNMQEPHFRPPTPPPSPAGLV